MARLSRQISSTSQDLSRTSHRKHASRRRERARDTSLPSRHRGLNGVSYKQLVLLTIAENKSKPDWRFQSLENAGLETSMKLGITPGAQYKKGVERGALLIDYLDKGEIRGEDDERRLFVKDDFRDKWSQALEVGSVPDETPKQRARRLKRRIRLVAKDELPDALDHHRLRIAMRRAAADGYDLDAIVEQETEMYVEDATLVESDADMIDNEPSTSKRVLDDLPSMTPLRAHPAPCPPPMTPQSLPRVGAPSTSTFIEDEFEPEVPAYAETGDMQVDAVETVPCCDAAAEAPQLQRRLKEQDAEIAGLREDNADMRTVLGSIWTKTTKTLFKRASS